VQIVRVDPEFLEGDDVVGGGSRGNSPRDFREAGEAVVGDEFKSPAVEGENVEGEGGGCGGGHGELDVETVMWAWTLDTWRESPPRDILT